MATSLPKRQYHCSVVQWCAYYCNCEHLLTAVHSITDVALAIARDVQLNHTKEPTGSAMHPVIQFVELREPLLEDQVP